MLPLLLSNVLKLHTFPISSMLKLLTLKAIVSKTVRLLKFCRYTRSVYIYRCTNFQQAVWSKAHPTQLDYELTAVKRGGAMESVDTGCAADCRTMEEGGVARGRSKRHFSKVALFCSTVPSGEIEQPNFRLVWWLGSIFLAEFCPTAWSRCFACSGVPRLFFIICHLKNIFVWLEKYFIGIFSSGGL